MEGYFSLCGQRHVPLLFRDIVRQIRQFFTEMQWSLFLYLPWWYYMSYKPSFCRYISPVYIGKVLYLLSKKWVSLSIYKKQHKNLFCISSLANAFKFGLRVRYSTKYGPPIITNFWSRILYYFWGKIRKPAHCFVLCRSPICFIFFAEFPLALLLKRHWTARFNVMRHQSSMLIM